MKVTLISHTPDPERVCAAAALGCYSRKPSRAIIEGIGPIKVERILRNVLSSGHHSVLEHANFTFSVEGVSRALTHQLVRHRIASYSQQSQRYVKFKKPGYVVPPRIAKEGEGDEGDEGEGGEGEEGESNRAGPIFERILSLCWKAYSQLLEFGIPEEDARYVLPSAAATNITFTMNARELLHFFRLRLCTRTQWELRTVARVMLRKCKDAAPVIFHRAGPTCETLGYCSEGEKGCGRAPILDEVLKKASSSSSKEL